MIIYDLDRLISVTIGDKRTSTEYVWQDAVKKTFWTSGKKEGFYELYSCSSDPIKTKEQLEEKGLIVDGKTVRYTPFVYLRFIDI